MKLHSSAFERALKRGVREAVRNAPKLRREFKRTKGRRGCHRTVWLVRLLFSGILAASTSTVFSQTRHTETALAVVVLWTLAAASFLSALLAPVQLQGADIRALQSLPLSDSTIYRFRRDKVLGFHAMVFFDLLAGLGTLAILLALPRLCWFGLPFIAALAWVFNVALAMFVGATFPRFRTVWVGYAIVMLAVAWILGRRFIGPEMMAALDLSAPALNVISPTAWPIDLFHWLSGDAWWRTLLGLLPVAYIVWNYRVSEQKVSARFTYREPVVVARAAEQISPGMTGGHEGFPIGVTTITEGILSRECFVLPEWDNDWGQKLLWRWFSQREGVLANFVISRPLAITRPWRRIVFHFSIAVAVWQLVRIFAPSLEPIAILFSMVIPGGEMLWQSWDTGAAFRRIRNFGTNASMFVPYPVAFREVSRLLLKCAVFQLPAMAAILVILAELFIVTHGLRNLWVGAASLALRVTFAVFALRMTLLVLNFASLSNDTSRLNVRGCLTLVIAVTEILLFAGLAGLATFYPVEFEAWIAVALLVASQYGFLRLYGWLWARGAFDLVSEDTR